MNHLLRQLPNVNALLELPHMQTLIEEFGRSDVTRKIRDSLDQTRARILNATLDERPAFESTQFSKSIRRAIEIDRRPNLRPVINATGIIIHTNLGRAPLAPQAITAIKDVAAQPSNLELDLATGERGSRYSHVEDLICDLTGAEAALVVNNCAAAVMLSLMATANGKKVIASRGELIEIGGAFRLPDVIEQSGAILKEVGATNKTRTSDYASAIDEDTAVLLKSHTSNFRIIGFTAAPTRTELASLASETKTILMEDLGSGVLIDLSPYGLTDEPIVSDILKAGVDLVMFSGDKLLGGPQAGIIAGRADLITKLKSHPLCRAVRIDKVSLAALEATLRLYKPPHNPVEVIPVLKTLAQSLSTIQTRAETLANVLGEMGVEDIHVCRAVAYVGGGSMPQQDLESYVVSLALPTLTANALASALRQADAPIVGRIESDRLLLDARTLTDDDLPLIKNAFQTLPLT